MIPYLFYADGDPEELLDANNDELIDADGEVIYAAGDPNVVRTFTSHGIGALSDAIFAEVTEERNGEFELSMEYPITGKRYNELELRRIILAKPNYTDDPQAFRIYYISTPIDGVVTISARHITYDLSGVPVLPFTATNSAIAAVWLTTKTAISHPFTIATNIAKFIDFSVTEPSSVRSWFGGKEGSMIDVYGGEWKYNNYTCRLMRERGSDRGVVIRYGKNLIDFNQEENCENVWTGVLPYWKDEEGNLVQASIINIGSYSYRRILCLDLSSEFEEQPTQGQLTARAQTYIKANKIGVPKVNITLNWAQLNERVDLCDTVKVVFERIGVETTAKCVRTVWDVLKDRYSSVEFGDAKTNITDTIAELQQETEKAKTSVSASMLTAIANATALITGNNGGYVVLHDSDSDGYPDEILVMDTPDVNTATRVWRFNKSGLGFSSSGASGPYGLAMTSAGEIVADFITTGTLSADRINGGTITSVEMNNGSGTFVVDASGNVTAASMAITGGYMTLDTQNVASGIKLQNTAGTTYSQYTAATTRRYVSSSLVYSVVNGAVSATSYNNISDKRLKDVLPEDVPDLSQIRAVRFKWKDGRDDEEHIGYLAQDVEEVAPNMVTDVDGLKVLDYIQLLTAKVEYLERRIEALEGRK